MGEDFCRQDRVWDYVILDEVEKTLTVSFIDKYSYIAAFNMIPFYQGHVIKNTNTKTSRTLHDIRAQHKLLLTGTPIQNNLMEFYNLMTWSNPNWLGSKSSFKIRYNDPIVAAQDPHVRVIELRIHYLFETIDSIRRPQSSEKSVKLPP
jgi:SNF2 family DNA or RNA helicase